jgi:hypothetical protein
LDAGSRDDLAFSSASWQSSSSSRSHFTHA